MKTAINLSILFLVAFGVVVSVVGHYLGFDVLGLAGVVSAVAVLHVISMFVVTDHTTKHSGRGLRATKSIRTIE